MFLLLQELTDLWKTGEKNIDKVYNNTMPVVYVLFLKSKPEEIRYVGVTKYETAATRLKGHRSAALKGMKLPVYDWMRKHGEDSIDATIVKSFLTLEEAYAAEKQLIHELRLANASLLNIADGGTGGYTGPPSKEAREKMAAGARGRVKSREERDKLSKANKGKKPSQAAIEASKLYNATHEVSDETRKKMSSSFKGRIISPEHRQKLREANLGKPFTDERRANLRAAWALRKEKKRRRSD